MMEDWEETEVAVEGGAVAVEKEDAEERDRGGEVGRGRGCA